jgi:putative MATE family efflux protein
LGALAADPLYSLIDTAFVGHLGVPQLGALAVGSAAFTASFWIFSFLAYGVTPRVARALGRGDKAEADRVGVQALFLAIVLGLGMSVIGLVGAEQIVRLFGGTERVAVYAEPFVRIRILAAAPVLIAQVGQGWMRGAGDTRTPMFVLLGGLVINTALNYVLIYPVGMGVQGSATATVIGQTVVAVIFVILLRRGMSAPRWLPDLDTIRSLAKVGLDLAVRTGSLLAALTVATAIAARMGEVALASWQIVMQVFLLLSFTLDSLAIAGQVLVGRFLGAQRPDRAFAVSKRLLGMALILGGGLAAALFLSSRWLATIFTDDGRVIVGAATLLVWLAVVQPLSAIAFTFDGILIGASDTRFLAGAMLLASAVYVAGSFLALELRWGIEGLAVATTMWLVLRSLTTGGRFVRGRWAI